MISHTSVRQYKTGGTQSARNRPAARRRLHSWKVPSNAPGDRLRINAELIDARTDSHVWAETYDRTAADLFAIQSELAESIVSQLKAKFRLQQKAEIEEAPDPRPRRV